MCYRFLPGVGGREGPAPWEALSSTNTTLPCSSSLMVFASTSWTTSHTQCSAHIMAPFPILEHLPPPPCQTHKAPTRAFSPPPTPFHAHGLGSALPVLSIMQPEPLSTHPSLASLCGSPFPLHCLPSHPSPLPLCDPLPARSPALSWSSWVSLNFFNVLWPSSLGHTPAITSKFPHLLPLPAPYRPSLSTPLTLPPTTSPETCPCHVPCPPHPPEWHRDDTVEVLLIHTEKMAVIFSQDDGGCPGCVIHQSQLSKVISLMQCGHQPLQPGLSHSPARPPNTQNRCTVGEPQGRRKAGDWQPWVH